MRVAAAIAFVASIILPFPAGAHEVRPAYLELKEIEPDTFAVAWKVPLYRGEPLYIRPVLPPDIEVLSPVVTQSVRGAELKRWTFRAEGGIAGQSIGIQNLDKS